MYIQFSSIHIPFKNMPVFSEIQEHLDYQTVLKLLWNNLQTLESMAISSLMLESRFIAHTIIGTAPNIANKKHLCLVFFMAQYLT